MRIKNLKMIDNFELYWIFERRNNNRVIHSELMNEIKEKKKNLESSWCLRFTLLLQPFTHEICTLERQSRFARATWIWRDDRHVGTRNVFEGWTSRNGITDNDLSTDFVHFLNPFFISKRIIPEALVNRLVIHVKDCGKNYSGKMRPILLSFR